MSSCITFFSISPDYSAEEGQTIFNNIINKFETFGLK